MNIGHNTSEYGRMTISGKDVKCSRDTNGRLVLHVGEKEIIGAHVVAAFPLSCWGSMISVRDEGGTEVGMIDHIGNLNPRSRQIMKTELEKSYFMPRIRDILFCEEKLDVITMEVETDRGCRTVQIRNVRKNIRNLPHYRVVIKDVDGNRYEICDWTQLSGPARSFLMQYI
ncbi:MAG: DUF1854 domain-containing protein [Verrucomicrobiota bacterium]